MLVRMASTSTYMRLGFMRLPGVAVCLSLFVLCGCSSTAESIPDGGPHVGPGSSSALSPAMRVTVSGHLLRVGGPPGAPSQGVPGTVTFVRSTGSTAAKVAADGTYSLRLAAGAYTPVGTSSVLGGVACHSSPSASVVIERSTVVDIVCDIR
jgi:hypothetical protein